MKRALYHFKEIDSTHLWARANLDTLDQEALSIVLADHQTKGRGRKGDPWLSSPGKNILVTYALFLQNPEPEQRLLALALTCRDLLIQKGFNATLKRPNDILINGKKVAGVLGETSLRDDGTWLLLSIGLNVNEELPLLKNINQPATSLFHESGTLYDRMALLGEISSLFEEKLK